MKSTRRPLLAIGTLLTLVSALLLSGCATGSAKGALDPAIEHPWSQDMAVVYNELPIKHKNLFFQLEESEYRQRLEDLNRRAHDLDSHHFEVALRRILADVGDAHTYISFDRTPLFPLQFSPSKRGSTSWRRCLGMRSISALG